MLLKLNRGKQEVTLSCLFRGYQGSALFLFKWKDKSKARVVHADGKAHVQPSKNSQDKCFVPLSSVLLREFLRINDCMPAKSQSTECIE